MKKIKLLFFTLLLLMGSSSTVHLASGWPVVPKICPSGYFMAPGFVKYKDGKKLYVICGDPDLEINYICCIAPKPF